MSISFKIIGLAVFALLMASACYGQKKAVEAYIITAANDTVQGLLKQQKEKHRLRSINFKPAGDRDFSSFGAAQIKAYGIMDTLLYLARAVKVEGLEQQVFVKVLVDGPVRLYATDDLSSEEAFFLQKPGEQPITLRKKKFLGELNYLLADCPDFKVDKKSAQKLKYTDEKLAATIHAYNSCRYPQHKSGILPTGRQFITRFGLRAGSQFGHMRYQAEKGMYRGRIDEKVALAPFVIGSAFVNISEAHKPLALQLELLLKRYDKAYTREEGDRIIPYTRVVHYSSSVLQFPVLLQYKLPVKQKAQPYIIAGPVGNYLFNAKFKYGILYSSSSIGNRTEDISIFSVGYAAGAGIQYRLSGRNRLVLDVRYSSDNVWAYEREPLGSPELRKFTFSGIQLTTGIML